MHARSVTTAALWDSEETVSTVICDVRDGFPVEVSSDAPTWTAGVRMIRSKAPSLKNLFFCLALGNAIDFPISICC